MEKISNRNGNIWAGLALLIIGAVLIVRQLNYFIFPPWVFTWEMLLIVIGLFVGFKNNFKGAAWFILILIGGVFITDEIAPGFDGKHYLWPIALIVIGAYLILRPRGYRKGKWTMDMNDPASASTSGDDVIDINAAFGGIHRVIMSKNFKGGQISSVFGGAKINLSQADINGQAVLNSTQIFGGTKLIIPADWEVKSEITTIFGGVEDKRQPHAGEVNKILVLKGLTMFGGLEISSF